MQQWGAAAYYGLALVMPFCCYALAIAMNSKLWDAVMSV